MNLKEALVGKLTKKEIDTLRAGYDVIGTIAIIEISKQHTKKQKIIAETLLKLIKNVKTIAVKQGGHFGKYRKQKLKIIAGEKNLETTIIENGVRLTLNVQDCYYSPRLGTERQRITKLVKKGEKILVAGAGIAPYPIVIAKHTPVQHITSVEANPIAHKYALLNIKQNKLLEKIEAIKSDIAKIKNEKYDRIISIIPHKGIKLAPTLLKYAKKGTILHIYDFASETDIEKPAKQLQKIADIQKKKLKIINIQKAGQAGVRKYRICIDAKVI